MKGKTAALAICGAVILAGACFFVISSLAEKAEEAKLRQFEEDYAQSHSYSYGLGESFILDAAEDRADGDAAHHFAGFDWSGSVEVCLDDAVMYPSVECAPVKERFLFYKPENAKEYSFLLCALTLRDIDSGAVDGNGTRNISLFALKNARNHESTATLAYFDGTAETALLAREVGHYELAAGEAKTLHLGYFIEKDADQTDFFYRIGFTPSNKYTVHFAARNEAGA